MHVYPEKPESSLALLVSFDVQTIAMKESAQPKHNRLINLTVRFGSKLRTTVMALAGALFVLHRRPRLPILKLLFLCQINISTKVRFNVVCLSFLLSRVRCGACLAPCVRSPGAGQVTRQELTPVLEHPYSTTTTTSLDSKIERPCSTSLSGLLVPS